MKSSVIFRQLVSAWACACMCIALVFPTVAQEQTTAPTPAQTQSKTADDTAHPIMIGSGDLLEVSVFGVPDLTRTVRVGESGAVYLPFIDAVKVAGLTTEQAQALIAKTYKDGNYLRDPQVSVLIKEYASQGIAVMGEVGKPGIYPLLGEVRLFDAISAAGGTTPKAGPKVTILHRGQPNDPDVITMNGSGSAASQSNVALEPGDTVIVSKAGIVYVMGDVTKPGGFVMENSDSLTAMQAVALAQGTQKTAALSKARLIRRGSSGVEEISVPLDKIYSAKAQDVKLQADDILFIPGSASRSAGMKTLETILQTIPGAAIYGAVRY